MDDLRALTIAELTTEVDVLVADIAARGHRNPLIKVTYDSHSWPWGRWTGTILLRDDTGRVLGTEGGSRSASAKDPSELLDKLREVIAALPHRWTAADVAATIGLPMCESCDEAVATVDAEDNPYSDAPPPRWCEPCLEAAWDRQNERAMEG